MDRTMMIRWGGRAAGAALAYSMVGRKMHGWHLVAAVALGWLAGGLAADSTVKV